MVEQRVQTSVSQELVNITAQVQAEVDRSGIKEGLCLVQIPHTTAGVTINEGADPAVKGDIIMALSRIVKGDWPFRHAEGNSPAHVKSSLMGASALIPVEDGKLRLGTWQQVFFCEFDGPRQRRFWVTVK